MNPAVYNEVQREYDLKRQKAINEAEQRKKDLAIMNREKKKAEAKKKKNSETEWKAIVRKCKEMGVSYGEAVRRGLI